MNSPKMTDEARKARNAYARKWRAENKEKAEAAIRRYWEKKAEMERETAASEQEAE